MLSTHLATAESRVFKTAWFTKNAKKSGISDTALCTAFREVLLGQADDLGGGVFKKRLSNNAYRSIILAKSGEHWFYEYLFAKKDRDNIDGKELATFRRLSSAYASLSREQLVRLCDDGDLQEICNGDEK
jgi:hypothetical protein